MNYKIGTRGSKLALAQAEMVRKCLQEAYPEDTFELCVIKTKGDQLKDVPLGKIGDKGIFVTEIEQQILKDQVQLGVHSMKDMPSRPAEGLIFARAWKREDARDVLILRTAQSLDALPEGAVIGTGSKRRAFQLLAMRKDLQIVDIRGNVDTRLKKMQEQKLDGIVLAAAGLKRLGMERMITQYLEPDEMIPAPAQGILALELKSSNEKLLAMLNGLADEETEKEAIAERGFLREMGGGCHVPIGAYCERDREGNLNLHGIYGDASGSWLKKVLVTGQEPELLAKKAAEQIRKERKGSVVLVGAGPGDPGLITVRGMEAVRRADCIIYDRLSSPLLLKEARPNCEKIYVGKENHHHTMQQEEINRLMVEKAYQYKSVVRLKGGDSYVFGRGGEEGIYLKEHGIPFSVIPGVSSAIAGPACAGIPVTHRRAASGFRVVTAHDSTGQMGKIDFSSMKNPKETLIFLMGLSKVGEIAVGLMQAGREAGTPAAVISHGATKKQRTVTGTLGNIAQKTKEAGLTSPALVVVGEVVRLRERQMLPFLEETDHNFSVVSESLEGKRYLVPVIQPFISQRLENTCDGLLSKTGGKRSFAEMLRKLGAEAEEIIVGQIQGISCSLSKEMLKEADWIIFSSGNGVAGFFENLQAAELDSRSLAGSSIAVIGKHTAEVLLSYGIQADYVSPKQHGESFGIELSEKIPDGANVFYFSAAENSGTIENNLKRTCHLVTIPVYENKETEFSCERRDYDGIFITSASSAARLFQAYDAKWPIPAVYSIGPNTTSCLKKLGVKEIIEAEEPSYEALIKLLKEEIVLVTPTMEYGDDIMQYRKEFLAFDPKEDMGGTGNLRDCKTAREWVDYVEAMHRKETCPSNLVDSDIFIGVRKADQKIVGMIEFRHHIDHPVLGTWGGHIGYCVRPGERRKGYGKQMLRQALNKCRAAGFARVMITCDEHNTASERTILANGGVYERTVWSDQLSTYMKRFWIEL